MEQKAQTWEEAVLSVKRYTSHILQTEKKKGTQEKSEPQNCPRCEGEPEFIPFPLKKPRTQETKETIRISQRRKQKCSVGRLAPPRVHAGLQLKIVPWRQNSHRQNLRTLRIHQQSRMVVIRAWEVGEWRVVYGSAVSVTQDEEVLEICCSAWCL